MGNKKKSNLVLTPKTEPVDGVSAETLYIMNSGASKAVIVSFRPNPKDPKMNDLMVMKHNISPFEYIGLLEYLKKGAVQDV